jgi:ubiquinone biosynthesis protein
MMAVLARDGEALVGAVLSVSRTTRIVNRTEFGAQLATLVEPVSGARLHDMRLGETLGRILHLLRAHGIVLPSDLAILIKTLIECEGTTNELDPTMSMLDLVGDLGSLTESPPKDLA